MDPAQAGYDVVNNVFRTFEPVVNHLCLGKSQQALTWRGPAWKKRTRASVRTPEAVVAKPPLEEHQNMAVGSHASCCTRNLDGILMTHVVPKNLWLPTHKSVIAEQGSGQSIRRFFQNSTRGLWPALHFVLSVLCTFLLFSGIFDQLQLGPAAYGRMHPNKSVLCKSSWPQLLDIEKCFHKQPFLTSSQGQPYGLNLRYAMPVMCHLGLAVLQ